MYAIVEIAGQQFKVAKDQKVFVNRLNGKEGDDLSFDNVLLTGDGNDVTLGAPAIEGALVGAKITRHLKGDKVIVFKKKRRKGYRVKNGHRQALTEILIGDITLKGGKKASAKKTETKEAPKKAAPKKEEVSEKQVPQAEKDNHELNADKLLKSIGTAKKSDADDLKEINGIGPAYEKKLNEVGVYTYEQISKLKASDRDELSALEGITREKIESEEWVKQAKALMKK